MRVLGLLRECGGLPPGIGLPAAAAVVSRTTRYMVPMQLPLLGGALVDALTGLPARLYGWEVPGAEGAVTTVGLVLVVLAVVQGAAAYADTVTVAHVKDRVGAHLRSRLLAALTAETPGERRRFEPDDLRRQAMQDIRAVRNAVVMRAVERPSLLLRMAFPVAMVVSIDARLALIPLAMPVLQWTLAQPLRRRLTERTAAAHDLRAAAATLAKTNRARRETLHTYGAQGLWLDRARSGMDALRSAGGRVAACRGLNHGTAWGLTSMALGAVWWLGGLRVLDGSLSVGALVALTGFVRFLNMPARRLAQVTARDNQGVAALERLAAVHRACADGQTSERPALRPASGEVRVEWRLRDASGMERRREAVFAPRSLHVVVGASGSGKTTALRVIAGLCDKDAGHAWVDGQDTASCDPATVRAHVRLVANDAVVFPGTVRQNLLMGRADPGDDALLDACAAADFATVVSRLPQGLDTMMGSGGTRLSRSERRRLGLARAFVDPPVVLLLDEPTAALDSDSAIRVNRTLADIAARATVVVTATAVPSGVTPRTVLSLDAPRHPEAAGSAHPASSSPSALVASEVRG